MIRSLCRVAARTSSSSSLRIASLPRFPLSNPRLFHTSRLARQDDHSKEGESKAEASKTESEAKPKAEGKTPEQTLLEKKDAEIEEFKRKYLTSLADMQNLRTRTQNDVTASKKYAATEFAKSMLEVADNLGFALKAAAPDATDANPKLKTFFEGVSMTQQALTKAFAAHQVVMYKSLGEKFDPNLHMGLYQLEDPSKEPGTVGNVVKEGYKLADRVLRAAQVGTVKAPSAQQPPAKSSTDTEQQKENVKLDLKTHNQGTPGEADSTVGHQPEPQKPPPENVTQIPSEKTTSAHPELQASS